MKVTHRTVAAILAAFVPLPAPFGAPRSDPRLDRSATASLQRLTADRTFARQLATAKANVANAGV